MRVANVAKVRRLFRNTNLKGVHRLGLLAGRNLAGPPLSRPVSVPLESVWQAKSEQSRPKSRFILEEIRSLALVPAFSLQGLTDSELQKAICTCACLIKLPAKEVSSVWSRTVDKCSSVRRARLGGTRVDFESIDFVYRATMLSRQPPHLIMDAANGNSASGKSREREREMAEKRVQTHRVRCLSCECNLALANDAPLLKQRLARTPLECAGVNAHAQRPFSTRSGSPSSHNFPIPTSDFLNLERGARASNRQTDHDKIKC